MAAPAAPPPESAPAAAPADTRRTRNRILVEALGLWAISAVSISGAVALGLSDTWISVVKSLALIYLPLAWILRSRRDFAEFGLHLGNVGSSLAVFAVVSVVTLVPFWSANHLWETIVLGRDFALRVPPDLAARAVGEVLAVALPEEVFDRGYLQTRLEEAFPPKRRILGASVGLALVAASVVFVAGHLVVRPAAWQLGIFFPSLVFGWLRVRTGSLLAPVLYHALCNVGMAVLQDSYR